MAGSSGYQPSLWRARNTSSTFLHVSPREMTLASSVVKFRRGPSRYMQWTLVNDSLRASARSFTFRALSGQTTAVPRGSIRWNRDASLRSQEQRSKRKCSSACGRQRRGGSSGNVDAPGLVRANASKCSETLGCNRDATRARHHRGHHACSVRDRSDPPSESASCAGLVALLQMRSSTASWSLGQDCCGGFLAVHARSRVPTVCRARSNGSVGDVGSACGLVCSNDAASSFWIVVSEVKAHGGRPRLDDELALKGQPLVLNVMPRKPSYSIDATRFSTLEEFAQHFSDQVLSGHQWSGNLDAFDDILCGGFGTPDEGFVLVWHGSRLSQERLGYAETVRQLEARLAKCHPANREKVLVELQRAQQEKGPTVYDWLVEIIKDHGPAGSQSEDGVELELR